MNLRRSTALLLPVLVASVCGRATPAAQLDAPVMEANTPHRIYVVRHDQHTGIVIPAADIPVNAWPARGEFATAEYFEVG